MAAPKFPGKGATPGMYTMPNGDQRYYSGGNDFYRSAPGNGAQVWGELTNGSGWRGMSQFDNYNDGRKKGGVESQNANPFAANFQLFDFPENAPIRGLIGERNPSKVNDKPVDVSPKTETVTNANGVTQTVQKLSGGGGPIKMTRDDVNAMYERQGLMGQSPASAFSSEQLIGTNSNPFTADYEMPANFGDEFPDIGGYNSATYDSETGRQAAGSQDISQFKPITGEEQRIGQQATGISSSRLSDALNGVKEQEANREMTPERRELMARAAFLDTEGSMRGLRAKEKVNGVVYAGGQHHIEDGDGYKAIDRQGARDIANFKKSPQDFLQKKVAETVESQKTTAAEEQSPPITFEQGMNSGLKVADYTDMATDTTAFQVNNGMGAADWETSVDIGNKGGKGYKKSFPGM
jgi:hypothetical protein